jgi:hypothetical protein
MAPCALERLSVRQSEYGCITRVRYPLLPHKAANWGVPGCGRKSTRPSVNGVVELSPFECLDRLADLMPPPRKRRDRYHGVFTPNRKLGPAVTALATANDAPPIPKKSGRSVFQPRPPFSHPIHARHAARYPHVEQDIVEGAG